MPDDPTPQVPNDNYVNARGIPGTPQWPPAVPGGSSAQAFGLPGERPAAPAKLPPETFRQGFASAARGQQYVVDAQGNVVAAPATASSSIRGKLGSILAGAALGALQGLTVARPGGIPNNEASGGAGAGARASQEFFQKQDLLNRAKAQENFENRQKVKQMSREEAESAARIAQYNATTAKQVQDTKFEAENHPYDVRQKQLANEEVLNRVQATRQQMTLSQLDMMKTLAGEGIEPSAVLTSYQQAQDHATELATGQKVALWDGKLGTDQGAGVYSTSDLRRPLTHAVTFSTWTTDKEGNPVEEKHTLQPGTASVMDYIDGAMMGQAQLTKIMSTQKVEGEVKFQKSEVTKNEATALAERARAGAESAAARFTDEQVKQLQSLGSNFPATASAPVDAFRMNPQQLGQALQSEGVSVPHNFDALYGLAHYKVDPNTFPARIYTGKGQAAAQMDKATAINFVRRFINPNYDENNYKAVQGMEKEFASTKPGSAGGNLVSFNTATEHLGQLYDAAMALRGGNVPVLNAIALAVSQQTGKAVKPNFEAIRSVLVGELGRLMKQAAPDVEEMAQILQTLSSSSSPEQFAGATQQFAHAMLAKGLEQVNHYYAYTGELPPGTFSPQARAIYDRMGIDLNSVLPTGALLPTGGSGGSKGAPPPGATAIAPGSDGKNHWTNAKANDLGVKED